MILDGRAAIRRAASNPATDGPLWEAEVDEPTRTDVAVLPWV